MVESKATPVEVTVDINTERTQVHIRIVSQDSLSVEAISRVIEDISQKVGSSGETEEKNTGF